MSQLFPVLRQWGATGLLVEWEDTFPYWGAQLAVIGSSGPDSPGLYSRQETEEFLNLAAHYDLEIVPLVQTFGHFEVCFQVLNNFFFIIILMLHFNLLPYFTFSLY